MIMKIYEPKRVIDAVNNLQMFFEADMWYAKGAEWKTEDDMLNYLKTHFNILKEQIEIIQKNV